MLNGLKYVFRLCQTVCLDDNFAHYWYYLNRLHKVLTWNGCNPADAASAELLSCSIASMQCRHSGSMELRNYIIEDKLWQETLN